MVFQSVTILVIIVYVNYRGIKPSGMFQDIMTFGLLATFAYKAGKPESSTASRSGSPRKAMRSMAPPTIRAWF